MCGISGYLTSSDKVSEDILKKMSIALFNRGPDNSGIWINEKYKIGLAHQRLSINDLSNAGSQPMLSKCKRFILVYNGEIYNNKFIREKIEKKFNSISWNGTSDTETLLNSLILFGVEETLDIIEGMFAFAFWDNLEENLIIARDRLGEKPLYFYKSSDFFIFASQICAIRNHPNISLEIDQNVLHNYLKFGYINSNQSIYKNIYKLLPGKYLIFNMRNMDLIQKSYWDVEKVINQEKQYKKNIRFLEYPYLEELLVNSVKSRMSNTDVSFGCFLSGGLDSSTIAAIMQRESNKPINTFSIGFFDEDYNEANYAKDLSNYLGTNHRELYLTENDVIKNINLMPMIYDEPFADISQLPTYILCKFASKYVKVALTGDGGDEIFCGYNRHLIGARLYELSNLVPSFLRKFASDNSDKFDSNYSDFLKFINIPNINLSNFRAKSNKFFRAIGSKDFGQYYYSLISNKRFADSILKFKKDYTHQEDIKSIPEFSNIRDHMMFLDQTEYLSNDILTKVDRASMFCSLEARTPFLNQELVEFNWSIPIQQKYKGVKGKLLLRKILYNYVPKELVERPKTGFGLPIEDWLRGPLKEWAYNILFLNDKEHDFFNESFLKVLWEQHQNNSKSNHNEIWRILMFNLWHKYWH